MVQQHHHHHHNPDSSTPAISVVDHDSHHGHHSQHSTHDHAVYFNFNTDMAVLFSGWSLNSRTGIFLLCFGILFLGILYQGIKHLRVYIHRDIPILNHTAFSREHALQTLLYGVQIVFSYILMLVIMTYNVWVFICTVVGLGIGFFLCEWHRPKTHQGSCQRECSKPISRVNTGISRLSVSDIKNTSDPELEHLSNAQDQCESCRDTGL